MKKILTLSAIVVAGFFASCGGGAETKPAADTTAVKTDTMAMPAAADTTKMDTAKGKGAEPSSTVPPKN
jgi:hypothetical protein